MQFLMNELNKGYSEYKRNHPDFAKFVERELEGKPEPGDQARNRLKSSPSDFSEQEQDEKLKSTAEAAVKFNEQIPEPPEPKEKEDDWYKDHCESCGEWLPYGVDICPECGRINK